nr:hypothetical protein Iba_scaffold1050390CG0010 [Ipomoea batatas]GMD42265.1 hypothetical protein Iba_chr10bCG7710 [Ipomoea batatas]GMD42267.1 hypothetical protein Iba_chr10bCG7730 [Ipomoea batatas]
MPHGHSQISAEASHNLLLTRLGQHFQHFSNLYIQPTKKLLQMHVGLSHIYLMVQMIKFKLLLTLECVHDWWSCYSILPQQL